MSALRVIQEKAATTGTKLDIIFCQLRIGFFFHDFEIVKRNLEKAEALVESTNLEAGGADWERRNRFKVYKGLASFCQRDFAGASKLFCDTLSTFNFTELMSNDQLVLYCAMTSLLHLSRVDFYKKILSSPEISEGLQNFPVLSKLIWSIYECQYGSYFEALSELELSVLKKDVWFYPHIRYLSRECRILAYKQFLTSYQSVNLSLMAKLFGVTEAWLDEELFRWITAGRLDCLMDKVDGTIRLDHYRTANGHKNALYEEMIKTGDNLLNRLQKLGRIVNV